MTYQFNVRFQGEIELSQVMKMAGKKVRGAVGDEAGNAKRAIIGFGSKINRGGSNEKKITEE